MSMRKLLKSLQKEVISGRKRFFSPERSRENSRDKDDEVVQNVTSSTVEWNEPTPRTCSILTEIYSKLFTETNELNLDFIEKSLILCPPDEDILLIEDRDHYNLMQKAINIRQCTSGEFTPESRLWSEWMQINRNMYCVQETSVSHERLGALHLASFLGRSDIVTLLLQRGCDRTLNKRVYTSAVVNDFDQQQPQLMKSSNFRWGIAEACMI